MHNNQIARACKKAIVSLDKNCCNYEELLGLMLDSLADSCGEEVSLNLRKELEEDGVL